MRVFQTDLLCIGAGLAGERVTVEAAQAGFDVVCLSLVPPRRSHSSAAQGGMQAALGNAIMGEGDSPDVHFMDTVKGSDWGCDQGSGPYLCGHRAHSHARDGLSRRALESRGTWRTYLL